MLFKETVNTSTFNLLNQLMNDEVFDSFLLVGGTALSLQIGHRKSIDLDLFSTDDFITQQVLEHLRINYNFELDYSSKNTLKGEVDGVQLDFITHKYPLIDKIKNIEDIRLASLLEIAAMKFNAITTNGTRIKDFIDLAFLSKLYSLNNMLDAYEQKYNSNKIIAIKSLAYFDEVNENEPINYISNEEIPWSIIKNQILEMINQPNIVFNNLKL